MKKLVLILLFIIPLHGFGQDINGTGWKISQDDGGQKIIIFENDGTFSYLNVKIDQWNEGDFYSDLTETWMLNDGVITISFSDGFKVHSGKINQKGDYMWGTWVNKKKSSGTWIGERIKF